jgi:hypothetical protein
MTFYVHSALNPSRDTFSELLKEKTTASLWQAQTQLKDEGDLLKNMTLRVR